MKKVIRLSAVLAGVVVATSAWGYEKNVPQVEWGQYRLVYDCTLPDTAKPFVAKGGFVYDVDKSDLAVDFDRVAYYLELEAGEGETQ